MQDLRDTIYHIYAKDNCIYNCLNEEDYTESDLSYIKLQGKVGYGGPGKVIYTEPMGDDSY